jgi:hypothetical protein
MKKSLLIAACLLFLYGCNPNNPTPGNPSPNTPSTPVLNSTEQSLVGVWYLKRNEDTTVYTGAPNTVTIDSTYTTAAYVEFKNTNTSAAAEPNDEYLDCLDGSGLSTLGQTSGTGIINSFWYYDENAQRLNVFGLQYEIKQLTSNILVVKYQLNINTAKTFYFTH